MTGRRYTSRDLAHWYGRGMQDERERAAGALYEAELAWGRTGAQISRDRHAELMRLFAQQAKALGRKEYHGGPVDWETGRPARRLEIAA